MPNAVKPIQKSVAAKPHRPVYRMHRYFARRPYSVFAELIKHYSRANDVILDPFCGGGVTLVESVLQGRRTIGLDLNPLAAFITRMELKDVDIKAIMKSQEDVYQKFQKLNDVLFATRCRDCGKNAKVIWFEYSAVTQCMVCSHKFSIAHSDKAGIATWLCPECSSQTRFVMDSQTVYKMNTLLYNCLQCGKKEIVAASRQDIILARKTESDLHDAEKKGLWIPNDMIPDCNMQRESALFKKGIFHFRQLFTSRQLLALGRLREMILQQPAKAQEWLLFAFSSTLRYTNRMATRNPNWRGDRPLEWSKPGYWLPAAFLEANVLEEFSRRCDAIVRGKKDYLKRLRPQYLQLKNSAPDVLNDDALSAYIGAHSATQLPLPDNSIDVIITDPPYGSYVHYADLSNFWAVWLPEVQGLGRIIDTSKEAVIARKQFPGAKSASDYQQILEQCFLECVRVLKDNGYMVLTFHNREPRAWAALLVAAVKAGFELPSKGIIFQDGIPSYKHTAQSRRAGSVIGDFILSFRKPREGSSRHTSNIYRKSDFTEKHVIKAVTQVLSEHGALKTEQLMVYLYMNLQPYLLKRVKEAVAQGSGGVEKLMLDIDSIQILDSHRRHLLEEHFMYKDKRWALGKQK